MKTYVVREAAQGSQWSYVTNAESALEAVKLAIARLNRAAGDYLVLDHDLSPTIIVADVRRP